MDGSSDRIRTLLYGTTVRRKLVLAFVGIALLTAVVGAVGLYGVSEVGATSASIANDGTETVDGVMMLKLESQRQRAALLRYVDGGEGAREEFEGANAKFDEVYESRLASSDHLSPEMQRKLEEAKRLHEAATADAEAAMAAKDAGDTEEMHAHLESYEQKQAQLESVLGDLEGLAKEELQSEVAAAERTERTSSALIVLLTLGSLGGALAVGYRVGGSIGAEVSRVRDLAERIARGQFDFEVEHSDRRDEIGDLVRSFQSMTDYLDTVSRQARAVSDQEFDADVLDEEVPGTLGEVMTGMADDIERAQREAETARDEVESLNESLERTADRYRETMARAAEGDLAQRMDPESESEAMVAVGEAFNEMMADIEEMVATLQAFTAEVADSSTAVAASADEIGTASEEAADAVDAIAESADDQVETLRRVNGELEGLSSSIEEIASSADEVASTTERAADRGQSGREAAESAIDEMGAIEATVDQTVDEVEGLAEEIGEIGDIVELITDIAEQTNILALNASIEAASAGEAGSGFAVVADEIKDLATEVNEATDDIAALIEDIQTSSRATVEDMQRLGDQVADGTDTIEAALTDLDEMVDTVEEINGSVQEISDATDDQATSTEEAVRAVDEVTRLAEDTSEQAGNAAAATEEQTAALETVSDRVESLTAGTDDLQAFLESFTVDADADATVSGTASRAATLSDGGRAADGD